MPLSFYLAKIIFLLAVCCFFTTIFLTAKYTLSFLAAHPKKKLAFSQPTKTLAKKKLHALDKFLPTKLTNKHAIFMVSFFLTHFLFLTLLFYLFLTPGKKYDIPRDSFTAFLTHQLTINDTKHYHALAAFGYLNPRDGQASLVFFPLYPFIIFLLLHLLPNYTLVGTLFNLCCLVLITKHWYNMVAARFSPTMAAISLGLFFYYPVSFITLTPQTEALFILLSLLTFKNLQQRQLPQASIWAFLAALTRPQGFLLTIALISYLYEQQRTNNITKLRIKAVLFSLSPLLVLSIYLALNFYLSNRVNTFLQMQDQHWHNTFQQPLLTIYQLAHAIFQIDLATATGRWGSALVYFMIACLAISYGCKKKFPLHYLTYPLASLLLTVSISNPMSAMRFFLVLFPIMIVGAHFFLSHKRTGAIYFYLLMLIQPLFWYLFVFYNGFIIC